MRIESGQYRGIYFPKWLAGEKNEIEELGNKGKEKGRKKRRKRP